MASIRVLLADDHAILRAGLRAILIAQTDIDVVGEAADGQDAIEQVRSLQPDIVVLDVSMPRVNGLMAARQIREEFPGMGILILTQYDNPEYVLPLLEAGASGYILKQAADVELLAAIRAVYQGDSFLHPSIAKIVVAAYTSAGQPDSYHSLTPREREVLILTAQGLTNREMAEIMNVSPKTIDVHRTRMMDKLDLHNVAEVTRFAMRRGLLDADLL